MIHRDEEIRHEREKTAEAEASKRALDQQLRDCSAKIDEAEAYARAEGKRTAAKYEGRVCFFQLIIFIVTKKSLFSIDCTT